MTSQRYNSFLIVQIILKIIYEKKKTPLSRGCIVAEL